MPKCSACGATIEFVKTKLGKAMPVDPDPIRIVKDKNGKTSGVTADGYVVRGSISTGDEAVAVRISHFATCPEANSFRRSR